MEFFSLGLLPIELCTFMILKISENLTNMQERYLTYKSLNPWICVICGLKVTAMESRSIIAGDRKE